MKRALKIKVAITQFAYEEGIKEKNLDKAIKYINKCAGEGAELVLLPEMFLTGYPSNIDMKDIAEPLDGENINKLKEIAVKEKTAIIGSYPELSDDGIIYNTAFFIDNKGKLLNRYRKIHLFDQERKYVNEGSELITVEYLGIRFGLLICFDIEFPEPARALALSGMDILLVSSANMEPYGLFHRIFSISRAIENHCFVVYSNRIGTNEMYRFVGDSCLVTPTGEIMKDLGAKEGLIVQELDLQAIAQSKTVFNYIEERRVCFNKLPLD